LAKLEAKIEWNLFSRHGICINYYYTTSV